MGESQTPFGGVETHWKKGPPELKEEGVPRNLVVRGGRLEEKGKAFTYSCYLEHKKEKYIDHKIKGRESSYIEKNLNLTIFTAEINKKKIHPKIPFRGSKRKFTGEKLNPPEQGEGKLPRHHHPKQRENYFKHQRPRRGSIARLAKVPTRARCYKETKTPKKEGTAAVSIPKRANRH